MSSETEEKSAKTYSSIWQRLFWILWFVLTVALLTYIIGAAIIIYSTKMKMEVIFSNRIRTPWFANLTECKSFGLIKCEDVELKGDDGKLGAWFISPSSTQYVKTDAFVLYLHGNMGSRALPHRVGLYKKLSKMGYHVLALDYRGFGDSEGTPYEEGLLQDAITSYKWLQKQAGSRAIYVWGHSLGAAVALQLSSLLNARSFRLNGLILEAPFNNMPDAIVHTPIAAPLARLVPNFRSYFKDMEEVFQSTYWIQIVKSPTIILHDVSDAIVNIKLGRRLYSLAKKVETTNVRMIEFDENLNHCNIYKAKNFKALLSDFVMETS